MESLNQWAEVWADFMRARVEESTLVFALVGLIWLLARKKVSPQFGYVLFFLPLLKLALWIPVELPARMPQWNPTAVIADAVPIGYFTKEPLPVATSDPEVSLESVGEGNSSESAAPSLSEPATYSPIDTGQPDTSISFTIPSIPAFLFMLWLPVVVYLAAKYLLNQFRFRQVLRHSSPLGSQYESLDLAKLCRQAGVRRSVRWVQSSSLNTPVVWGIWRPHLILPTRFGPDFTPDQMKWILLHELAHIRRWDLLAALFQRAVGIFFFFHPVVWVSNRTLNRLREFICDDTALVKSGISRLECGEGFLAVAEQVKRTPVYAEALLGFMEEPSLVRRRMMRILDGERKLTVKVSLGSAAVLLLIAAVVLPSVRAGETQAESVATEGTVVDFSTEISNSSVASPPPNQLYGPTISTIRQIHVSNSVGLSLLSPDGKHMACIAGSNELLVLDLNTGEYDKIYGPQLSIWGIKPLWSPDGKRLAYVKKTPDGTKNLLVTTDIETKSTELLFDLKDDCFRLEDWSRDGKYILATEYPGMEKHKKHTILLFSLETKEIASFETNDQDPTDYPAPGGYEIYPRFSPQGEWISYRVNNGERNYIHIQSLDGQKHYQSSDLSKIHRPFWSSDGQYLLYVGYMGKETALCAVKVKEGEIVSKPFIVLPKFERGSPLTLTPSNQLAYSTSETWGLYILDIDPETKKAEGYPQLISEDIETNKIYEYHPHAWAADGKTILQSWRELSLAGDVLQSIKVDGALNHVNSFCCSKDGTFLVGIDYEQGIFKLNRQTGKLDILMPLGPYQWYSFCDLANDDRTLVYQSNNSIYKIDLNTLRVNDIDKVVQGKADFFPAISPDQTQVAFVQYDDSSRRYDIVVSSLLEGATREVARFSNQKQISSLDWSPDGQCLAYISDQLWITPLDGKPAYFLEMPRHVSFNYLSHALWSPDGKQISFVASHQDDIQYWVLDNLEIRPPMAFEELSKKEIGELPADLKPASVELIRYTDTKANGNYVAVPTNSSYSVFRRECKTAYNLVESGLQDGEMQFTDRTYKYINIPSEFKGLPFLQSPAGDRSIWDKDYQVVLIVKNPTYVFVGIETRTLDYWKEMGKPQWIQGYTPTAYKIYSDNPDHKALGTCHEIYVKKVPPGELVLGPNRSMGSTDMYIAFFGEE